jgi:hypothetical protein
MSFTSKSSCSTPAPFRQKKGLYGRLVELLGEDPGIRPKDVFLTVLEAAKENWSVGHGLAQFA